MTNEEAHMILEEKQSEMTKFRSCHTEREITANGIAILAVEKQIPKKPCIEKTLIYDKINCPNCGKRLVHRDERGFFAGALNDYCFNCGQRLDWSNDDAEIH